MDAVYRFEGARVVTGPMAGGPWENFCRHRLDPPFVAGGRHVAGIYRQRVTLTSGRFAMIDDGLGFQLVPWRPALDQQLGRQVSGVMMSGGRVDWSFDRKRGLAL